MLNDGEAYTTHMLKTVRSRPDLENALDFGPATKRAVQREGRIAVAWRTTPTRRRHTSKQHAHKTELAMRAEILSRIESYAFI